MLSRLLIKRLKRSLKRHQTGQAIIILALGFIVLLGFVGVVTDVSLLYIRYAALRRAVDSAAVAAAGQMRTDREPTAPKLAAIQFLEFHGINTNSVFVETCADMPPFWNDPVSADHVDDDGNVLPSDSPERENRKGLYDEVCDSQRKLVRVTAFIESPTVFMSLPPFNFETITLSAASVSETATLDVVIVLDVSESMLFETTYEDWNSELFRGNGNQWARYLPPRIEDWLDYYNNLNIATQPTRTVRRDFLATYSQAEFLAEARGGGVVPYTTGGLESPSVTLDFTPATYYMNASNQPIVIDRGSPINQELYNLPSAAPRPPEVYDMRPDCRIRIQPYAALSGVYGNATNPDDSTDITTLYGQWLELTRNYDTDILDNYQSQGWETGGFDMFVPAYDFYGCCNDPTAGATVDLDGNIALSGDPVNWGTNDFDFSDLVCQPFKEARDATRTFLQNIDFSRGDRVAFVTFDRAAYLIDPDGYNFNSSPGSDARVTTGGIRPHMIDDFEVAVEVLNRVVGVRAEPNFYYTDHNANESLAPGDIGPVDLWENYSSGAITVPADVNGNGEVSSGEVAVIGQELPATYFDAPVGEMRSGYHVRGSCQFRNAALPGAYSIWTGVDSGGFFGEGGPLYDVMTPPAATDTGWYDHYNNILGGVNPEQFAALFSYENLASCRGTNIGAGLREANNALVSPLTSRQEGAVWVIVLLGDGAAGATDPIASDPDTTLADQADPYLRDTDDNPDVYSPDNSALPDESTYGAYGFCPSGSPSAVTGLTDDTSAPYCVDPNPSTRHSCNTDAGGDPWNKTEIPSDDEIDGVLTQYITGNAFSDTDESCAKRYDADDYARDWADYVAMDRQQLSGEQLPVIFTIGFNLDYPVTPGPGETLCTANIQMCLGEELLRYIANVGDNNRYDVDEYPNTFTDSGDAGVDYGNYYNAPDQARLGDVFDEIAGKLFTRIAG